MKVSPLIVCLSLAVAPILSQARDNAQDASQQASPQQKAQIQLVEEAQQDATTRDSRLSLPGVTPQSGYRCRLEPEGSVCCWEDKYGVTHCSVF